MVAVSIFIQFREEFNLQNAMFSVKHHELSVENVRPKCESIESP